MYTVHRPERTNWLKLVQLKDLGILTINVDASGVCIFQYSHFRSVWREIFSKRLIFNIKR